MLVIVGARVAQIISAGWGRRESTGWRGLGWSRLLSGTRRHSLSIVLDQSSLYLYAIHLDGDLGDAEIENEGHAE